MAVEMQSVSTTPFAGGGIQPDARVRTGEPANVILVAEPALLQLMREAVEATQDVKLAAAFHTAEELTQWLEGARRDWDLAFVDFALRRGRPATVVESLLADPAAGEVVALGECRWPEMQEACAAMGVHRLINRGDLKALRGCLEEWR